MNMQQNLFPQRQRETLYWRGWVHSRKQFIEFFLQKYSV